MKKLAAPFLIAFCLLLTADSFSQIKVSKATQQKTFGGMGGVFMNYVIDFNNKGPDKIEIDSVKTAADSSVIQFGFTRFDPCCKHEISFSYALSPPAKCRTCPDTASKQQNTTKGVIVYYRKGDKKLSMKVKKFKRLPDLMLP